MKTFSRILVTLSALAMTLPAAAQFSTPGRRYVEYLVVPSHHDFVYELGEPAVVRVEAMAGGLPVDGVQLWVEQGDDQMPVSSRDTLVFHDGVAYVPVLSTAQPGFRFCNIAFEVGGQRYTDAIKLAFSPDKIQTCTTMPDDFREFWKGVLAEAEAVPLNPQLTELPQYSNEKVVVYHVCLATGPGGRTTYGYMAMPRAEGRYPVLFSPPGAGNNKVFPSTNYAEQGYIYFNINIHDGHDSSLPDEEYNRIRAASESYQQMRLDSRDDFYYKGVYAACSRCIDFLCSLDNWDGRNVGVNGGSQGGMLSIITAALNPKVTFSTAFYPAMTDVLGFLHGRGGGWPRYFSQNPQGLPSVAERDTRPLPAGVGPIIAYPDASAEDKAKAAATLVYYDVINFARILKCPLFLSYGYADVSCCPTAATALRNLLPASAEVVITPRSAHWRYSETNDKAMAWQKAQLK